MKEIPEFPIIMTNSRGAVSGASGTDEISRHSLYGICHWSKYERRYFDAKGIIWSSFIVEAPYPVNIWTRIISQVYNPWFTVKFGWKSEGSYTLPELQERLCHCVDLDDDILTQFMEADKVKELIREAKSFAHLFTRMKKMKII